MFVELIDTSGHVRYVNPDYVVEIMPVGQYYKICLIDGYSYFTDHNVKRLLRSHVRKNKARR